MPTATHAAATSTDLQTTIPPVAVSARYSQQTAPPSLPPASQRRKQPHLLSLHKKQRSARREATTRTARCAPAAFHRTRTTPASTARRAATKKQAREMTSSRPSTCRCLGRSQRTSIMRALRSNRRLQHQASLSLRLLERCLLTSAQETWASKACNPF